MKLFCASSRVGIAKYIRQVFNQEKKKKEVGEVFKDHEN